MFALPELPYGYDALEPTVSATTMHTHHDKHHAKYVDTLNGLVGDKPELAALSLEDVVRKAAESGEKKLFNQAGQAWNHGFFWECQAPSGVPPEGPLADAIKSAFGDLNGLRDAFKKEGEGHFGSGWVWLVAEGGTLKVTSLHDGETPLTQARGATPLLTCDVWEHAYYLDYKQDRGGFLGKWFDTVANWRFAAAQLASAGGEGGYRYPAPTAGNATAA